MENQSYEEYVSKQEMLDDIEQTTGVDMSFQRGCLDAKQFGTTVSIKKPDEPGYSAYDVGLEYTLRKEYGKLRSMFEQEETVNREIITPTPQEELPPILK